MNASQTPYALIFRDTGISEEYFPRIRAELPEAPIIPARESFFTVPAVGELLRAIAPESGAGAAQIGLLVYHAYSFWRSGEHQWSLAEDELRPLLSGDVIGSWPLALPAAAGYLQLPRHRFWVASEREAPAEPVDGFFWTAPPAAEAMGPELLLLLGMHGGRDGVSVVELPAAATPPEGHWGDIDARGDGEDFANILPGGEHLFGLRTAGEALKLASRVFWHLEANGSAGDRAGSGGDR